MKEIVIFINVFWGKIVDEEVLIYVLIEKKIFVVGIDIFI